MTLYPSDEPTVIVCLENEHRRIVELLNSGKVTNDAQDRALRDRDYHIEKILKQNGLE